MIPILAATIASSLPPGGAPNELVIHEVTQPSLALSPDERLLYFGVLGDLVALSVDGGEARLLTTGSAFDHDPQPTRDGRALHFLSDRAGEEAVFRLDLQSLVVEPTDLDARLHARTVRILEDGTRVGLDYRDLQRPMYWMDDGEYTEHYRPAPGRCIEWAGLDPRGRFAALALSGPWDRGRPEGVEVTILDLNEDRVIHALPRRVHTGEQDRSTRAVLGEDRAYIPDAGHILAIDLESGDARRLEWTVHLPLTLPPATRPRQASPPAAGADAAPRGIDRVHPSGTGAQVVFAMLGDLWLQETVGVSRPLTQGPDLDRMPQFGPGDEHVYFARNGQLARIPGKGGDVEVLGPAVATEYLDAFQLSPDGGALVSPISIIAPGVQVAEVGKPWTVLLPGRRGRGSWVSFPAYGKGDELLFTALIERGGLPQVYSLPRGTGDPVGVTQLERPPKRVVGSRDGNWLAVLRDGRAWLARRTGEILVEVDFEAVGPVGAHSLSFSADSTQLWVAAGTEVCVVPCEGSRVATTFRLQVPDRAPATVEPLVLEGCHVIDVITGEVLRDRRITMTDGRIQGIEERSRDYEGEAVRVDATDLYVIPGLFDMHVHQVASVGPSLLAWGVTTVRQLGSVWPMQLTQPELFQRGERLGPRHLSSGEIFEGIPPAWGSAFHLIDSELEARALVERRALDGIFEVKLYPTLARSLQKVVCDQAARSGVGVTSHVSNLREAVTALLDGAGCLEHWPEDLPDLRGDLLALMKATGAAWCPTLSVRGAGDLKRRMEPHQFDEPLFRATVPRGTLQRWSSRDKVGSMTDTNLETLMEARAAGIVRAWRAGVRILVGSDCSVSNALVGPSTHWELEWLVRGGMEPHEALRCATVDAAQYAGLEDQGVLRGGAIADLVLLAENPLEDIRATRSVEGVVLGGRLLWREDLIK